MLKKLFCYLRKTNFDAKIVITVDRQKELKRREIMFDSKC